VHPAEAASAVSGEEVEPAARHRGEHIRNAVVVEVACCDIADRPGNAKRTGIVDQPRRIEPALDFFEDA